MIFVIPSLPKNDMNIHIVSVHDGKSLLNVKCVNPQVVKINQTAIFIGYTVENKGLGCYIGLVLNLTSMV